MQAGEVLKLLKKNFRDIGADKMDKKKIIILASVFLCVILFLVELAMIEMDEGEQDNLAQVKSRFQDEIQELKSGKYENLVAADFEVSIEEVENVYRLQILHPKGYANASFLENFTSVIEDELPQEEANTLEILWNPNYRNQKVQGAVEFVNQVVDDFFQTEVDETTLEVMYWLDEECIRTKYSVFMDWLADGLTTYRDVVSLFGNTISEGGYMIQIDSGLNGAWFSRGELGDIMPLSNDCKGIYSYLEGKRQGMDVVLHLLDGDILLSEMEKRVLEYLNTDAFPLPKTEGIDYEIGAALVLENEKYENYDGICFIVRRVYKGVSFACGVWKTWYDCDTSEISYARSDSPDTMRDFYGLNGEVMEMEEVEDILSAGEALECLSNYFGNKNGFYEIRGVELVYKNAPVSSEDIFKISDILEPKWMFTVCAGGSGKELTYFVDAVTGEMG